LVIKPSAKKLIIDQGYDEKFGARPLRRAIQDLLEHKIAEGILSGVYEKGTVLNINANKGEIEVEIVNEA
jgi:ATP-dependent Clp protease ATP-binding subunit ClpC